MTESRPMSVTTVTIIRQRKNFSSCTAWKAAKTLFPTLNLRVDLHADLSTHSDTFLSGVYVAPC